MASLEASISVKTEIESSTEDDEDDVYGAFEYIKARIFQKGTSKAIGKISGVKVNRQKIPRDAFYETFDMHSADMEWVGGTILENRHGRTKFKSLYDAGDDPEFDFLLIQKFEIEGSCDVATIALRKFLHSEHVKGDEHYTGCWNVSSVAFVLDKAETISNNEMHASQQNSNNAVENENPRCRPAWMMPTPQKSHGKRKQDAD